jgi:phage-related protein
VSTFNAGAIEATLTLGRSSWTRDLQKTKKEIAELEKKTITVGIDADADNAHVAMDNIEMLLDDLAAQTFTPKITVADAEARATIERLEAKLVELGARDVVIGFDADTDNFFVKADNVEKEMDLLETDSVKIEFDAQTAGFDAHAAEIEAQIRVLSAMAVNIDVDYDTAAAEAHAAEIIAQTELLDALSADIDVDYDRDVMEGLVGGGMSGGHLGLLRLLIIALIALSPILAVATSALTATIIAFAAAVVGAAGPVLILAGGLALLISEFKKAKEAGEMTPAMEHLADALENLKGILDDVREGIGDAGFNLMADAINLLAQIVPTLVPLFNATAGAISGVLGEVSNFVSSSEYDEMLDFFGGFGVDMLVQFLHIGGNLLRFFGRLFQAIEPFARNMMQGLEDTTAGWAEWADDLENNDAFQQFMANAAHYGPMVLDMLGSMLRAFMKIGEAIEPFAGPMLEGLTFFFDTIANADTGTLTIIVGLLAGLWTASHILLPLLMPIAEGIGAIMAATGIGLGPLLLIAVAVGALAWAITDLWKNSEDFRNGIKDVWTDIQNTVEPIVSDVSDFIREHWGEIVEWASGIWEDYRSTVEDAFTSIEQIIHAILWVIRGYWEEFGDETIQIFSGTFQIIGAIISFFFGTVSKIMHLIKSILTGDWKEAGKTIVAIGRGFIDLLVGIFKGWLTAMRGIVSAIAKMLNLQAIWNGLRNGARNAVGWVRDAFNGLVGWFGKLPGRIAGALGNMWNGLTTGFRSAVNAIVRWWNNLSFGIPAFNPPGPGSFPAIQVNTPNINEFADGAFVTEPTLAWVGEGRENEIVAPESKMEEMARQAAEAASGGGVDYDRMATVIAAAIATVMSQFGGGVTAEQLEALIRAASVNVQIDASDQTGAATLLAAALGFELRRLGYGGKANV